MNYEVYQVGNNVYVRLGPRRPVCKISGGRPLSDKKRLALIIAALLNALVADGQVVPA